MLHREQAVRAAEAVAFSRRRAWSTPKRTSPMSTTTYNSRLPKLTRCGTGASVRRVSTVVKRRRVMCESVPTTSQQSSQLPLSSSVNHNVSVKPDTGTPEGGRQLSQLPQNVYTTTYHRPGGRVLSEPVQLACPLHTSPSPMLTKVSSTELFSTRQLDVEEDVYPLLVVPGEILGMPCRAHRTHSESACVFRLWACRMK